MYCMISVLFLLIQNPLVSSARVESIGPPGGSIRSVAVVSPGVLLAGTFHGKLYLSSSNGEQWNEITPPAIRKDHVIEDIVVSPDGLTIYLAIRALKDGFILRSVFPEKPTAEAIKAVQWEKILPGNSIRSIVISSEPVPSIYVGTDERVFISLDNGQSWSTSTFPFPDPQIESLVLDPDAPGTVYAGSWQRPYRSSDRGKSWHAIHAGMAPDSDVFTMIFDQSKTLFAGTCGYVYRSDNRGEKWTKLMTGLNSKRMHVLKMTTGGDIVAGSDSGLYRLDREESSWKQILNHIIIHDIAIDQMGYLVCATEGEGIIRVEYPSGQFVKINQGIFASSPRRVFKNKQNGVIAAIINQHNSNGIWIQDLAGWRQLPLDGLQDIQDVLFIEDMFFVATSDGLYIYAKNESGWFHVHLQTGNSIQKLFYTKKQQNLLAATSNGLLSMNLKTYESHLDESLKGVTILNIWASSTKSGAILAGTLDGLVRYYPSSNIWVKRARSLGDIPIYEISSNRDESILYLATGDGVYQTDDLGDTVAKLAGEFPDLACVGISTCENRIAALFSNGTVFQQVGDASTWSSVATIPAHAWHIACFDNDESIYVGTDGSGVIRCQPDQPSF